jgi:KUP system potassium uptake protein
MVACVALVLGFRESGNLAAAYGIAVTGTMGITSFLFYVVATRVFHWTRLFAALVTGAFMTVDLAFFSANVVKIKEGGWFPLAVGLCVFTIMTTWKRGRDALGAFMREATLPLTLFMDDLNAAPPHRVKGTAVFMTSNPDGAPPVLLHHLKHNKVLHEQVVLLSITTTHDPEVPSEKRLAKVTNLGLGFYQVTEAYGFMQTPNVMEVLRACSSADLHVAEADTSFFLGRETLIITEKKGMARWRKVLFSFLSRNARPANAFFRIPPNRVVELGTQIEL